MGGHKDHSDSDKEFHERTGTDLKHELHKHKASGVSHGSCDHGHKHHCQYDKEFHERTLKELEEEQERKHQAYVKAHALERQHHHHLLHHVAVEADQGRKREDDHAGHQHHCHKNHCEFDKEFHEKKQPKQLKEEREHKHEHVKELQAAAAKKAPSPA